MTAMPGGLFAGETWVSGESGVSHSRPFTMPHKQSCARSRTNRATGATQPKAILQAICTNGPLGYTRRAIQYP